MNLFISRMHYESALLGECGSAARPPELLPPPFFNGAAGGGAPRQKGRPRKRKPKDLEGMTANLGEFRDNMYIWCESECKKFHSFSTLALLLQLLFLADVSISDVFLCLTLSKRESAAAEWYRITNRHHDHLGRWLLTRRTQKKDNNSGSKSIAVRSKPKSKYTNNLYAFIFNSARNWTRLRKLFYEWRFIKKLR